VRSYLSERIAAKRAERGALDRALEAWRSAHPERAAAWERARQRELPVDLSARLAEGLEGKSDATRKHSGAVIQRLAEAAPYLVGGSGDLAGSNNTNIDGAAEVGKGEDPFAGRNIHFGVREHSMAAVTNGIVLDGTFRPFCGTFLVFSDYMRPSLRLAALMKAPTIFVFTHDSIFVGEDGPTHQPIEHLDALRAIPNLTVFRPADGVETAMAWAFALQRATGPVAIILTRQKVPALKREVPFANEDAWRGGYLVREPKGRPDVVLLASGSEVPLSCEAAGLLASEGVSARVVSVPSLELLEAQEPSYRESLIPAEVPAVAVEAARGDSYRALVGRGGLVYGIHGFGASASAEDLAEHFGFTPSQLAAAVRRHLGR
jgi:transketolase